MIKNSEFLKKAKEIFQKIWNIPVLFSFILAFLIVGVVEAFSRHSFFGGVQFLLEEPLFYIMTAVCITGVLTLTYFFKKRVFAIFFVSFVIIAMAVVNFILLFTRITPFEAVDFSILRTGISIVKVYLNTFQIILCVVGILAALFGIVLIFIKSPKSEVNIKDALIQSMAAISVAVVFVVLFSGFGVLPRSFQDTNKAYEKYGFVYCFTRSIFDRGIEVPDDYGKGSVEEILSLIGGDKTKDPDSTPNVIIIQLESFMDPEILNGVEFEYDPMPNFKVLKENCTSGVLYVPSVGSGTANTEFEVLTGMCLDYFGTGEYPYKTILQSKNCETICYNLAELGYTSHAFHNHTGTFYNRNIVYKNLGFNTFTPLEYMHSYSTNPLGWAKDYILEDEIMMALKSTKGRDFIFAVSVQGHGKHPEKPVEGESLIPCTGVEDEAFKHQLEYYAYQMWEMDDFIGRLVRTLAKYDEDCILVLYGDHQPSLEYDEEDILYKDKHASEYVIWSSFKSEENDCDIEAYQLTAYTLSQIGINNGLITKLHQNYSDSEDYERALEVLEYDMLYGDMLSYGEGHEYVSPDMKLGIREIRVTGVSYVGDEYYILGENFTQSSVVCVNGKEKDTLYVSPTVLILEGDIPETGSSISVKQITNDMVILGETEPFLFSGVSDNNDIEPDDFED